MKPERTRPAAQAPAHEPRRTIPQRHRRPGLDFWVPAIFLVVAAVAHAVFGAGIGLRAEAAARPFFWDYATGAARVPGGLAIQWHTLLLRLEVLWPVVGVVALAAEAMLLAVLSRAVFKPLRNGALGALELLPAGVWLILLGFYHAPVHWISLNVLLALALVMTVGFLRHTALRAVACWLAAGLAWFLAGPLSSGLVAGLLAAIEWAAQRNLPAGLCALAGAPAIFGLASGPSVLAWAGPGAKGLAGALTLAFPLSFLAVAVCLALTRKLADSNTPQTMDRPVAPWVRFAPGGLLILSGILAFFAVDPLLKQELEIRRLNARADWRALLSKAQNAGEMTVPGRVCVLRALAREGELGERLFDFPQVKGRPLVPEVSAPPDAYVPTSELLLDLGQVNAAEHMAQEALEVRGALPRTLALLGAIYTLKGQPEAAEVFLNRLSRAPGGRAEAELSKTWGQSMNPSLTDAVQPSFSTEEFYLQCLRGNPTNRMAFEMLMATYLLESNLEKLVARLPELRRLGYRELPRHYAEAALLYQAMNTGAKLNLGDMVIREETARGFARFSQAVQGLRRPGAPRPELDPKARRSLAAQFGDTFWFYHLFGGNPGCSASRRNT